MPVSFAIGLLVIGAVLLPAGLICVKALDVITGSEPETSIAENTFSALLVGLIGVSWVSLVLAEFGAFSSKYLLIAVLVICALSLLLVARGRALGGFPSFRLAAVPSLLSIVLLVSSGILFFRPFEYFFGGADPGVYVNTAVSIAKTGALIFTDSDIVGLSDEAREVLFTYVPSPWTRSGLAGYTVLDFDTGALEPHGFHLFPAWLATTITLFGLKYGLTGIPILALLSIGFLFLLGRRLFGTTVGFVASLLLVTNISQVWFARFPAAEIMVQTFLLGGMLSFVIMIDKENKRAALVAGLSFGMVHLTKIEMLFLPVTIGLFFCLLWLNGRLRRVHAFFAVSYLLVTLYALFHAIIFAPAYIVGTLEAFLPKLNYSSLALADPKHPYSLQTAVDLFFDNQSAIDLLSSAFLIIVLGLIFIRWKKVSFESLPSRVTHSFPYALGGAILALAIYAYFIRPIGSEHWAGTDLTNPDSTSFVRLGWFVSRPGLLLAVLGAVALSAKRVKFDVRVGFLLLMGGAALLQTLSEGRITPFQFWAGRRLVPFVIPFSELMIGFSIVYMGNWRPKIVSQGLVVLAVGFLVFANLRTVAPFFLHIEDEGSLDQIAIMSANIPDNVVLLLEWSSSSGKVATPLRMVFGRSVFALSPESTKDIRLANVIDGWLNIGKEVYWLSTPNGSTISLPGYQLRQNAPITITTPEAETTTERLPIDINNSTIDFLIYKINKES